jgi:hypothetical protein
MLNIIKENQEVIENVANCKLLFCPDAPPMGIQLFFHRSLCFTVCDIDGILHVIYFEKDRNSQ